MPGQRTYGSYNWKPEDFAYAQQPQQRSYVPQYDYQGQQPIGQEFGMLGGMGGRGMGEFDTRPKEDRKLDLIDQIAIFAGSLSGNQQAIQNSQMNMERRRQRRYDEQMRDQLAVVGQQKLAQQAAEDEAKRKLAMYQMLPALAAQIDTQGGGQVDTGALLEALVSGDPAALRGFYKQTPQQQSYGQEFGKGQAGEDIAQMYEEPQRERKAAEVAATTKARAGAEFEADKARSEFDVAQAGKKAGAEARARSLAGTPAEKSNDPIVKRLYSGMRYSTTQQEDPETGLLTTSRAFPETPQTLAYNEDWTRKHMAAYAAKDPKRYVPSDIVAIANATENGEDKRKFLRDVIRKSGNDPRLIAALDQELRAASQVPSWQPPDLGGGAPLLP